MEEHTVLISSERIRDRVGELAGQISADYANKNPLIVTLLKGAFIFLADLVRHLTIRHEIDFITLSSYRRGLHRSPEVEILNHMRSGIAERHVIIVDEIIDTGHTMSKIMETLGGERPRSMKVCTLLDKPAAREVYVPVHYVGFTIPPIFVVGYGLDFMEHFRNLSYIAEMKPGIAELGIEERTVAPPYRMAEELHAGIDAESAGAAPVPILAPGKTFADPSDS